MVRKVLTGVVLSAVLAMLASPVLANEASITYRFEGPYPRAFADSRDHWNAAARRVGAPQLIRDTDGRHVGFVVRSKCEPGETGSPGSYTWKPGADVLLVNVCRTLDPTLRRKVYSHEIGHALMGERHYMGLTVMRANLDEQRLLYPGRKDEKMLGRHWD